MRRPVLRTPAWPVRDPPWERSAPGLVIQPRTDTETAARVARCEVGFVAMQLVLRYR